MRDNNKGMALFFLQLIAPEKAGARNSVTEYGEYLN
jgi:hypothetical protein